MKKGLIVFTIVLAVTLALLGSAEADRWGALVMVFVGGVLATFLAQLLTRTPHGFLHRARLSVFGVFVLVVLGSALGLLAR